MATKHANKVPQVKELSRKYVAKFAFDEESILGEYDTIEEARDAIANFFTEEGPMEPDSTYYIYKMVEAVTPNVGITLRQIKE